DGLRALEANPEDPEALKAVESFFHRIAGTAPSVGLNLLGRLADMGERAAGLVVRKLVAPKEVLLILSEGLLGAEEVVQQPREGGSETEASILSLVSNSDASQGEGPRILVIDDDPFSAQLIQLCLRDAGFQATPCLRPQDALAQVEAEHPDLIVL